MLKSTPKQLIFMATFLALGTVFSSCADEDLMSELFEQQQQNTPEEPGSENPDTPETPQGSNQDPGDPVTFESQLEINSTPCDFGLDTLQANGTLALECSLDLGGQTVTLPAGVTLEYAGGQIINGTLVFNGGYIDGKLMNKDLTLEGSVSLTSDTFQLFPERWELVQGQTTSEIAQRNNDVLEGLMFYTKELGARTFVIDEFDAYFEISKVTSTTTNQNFYNTIESINVPGNFNLEMSERTFLRVFPNDRENGGTLLAAREVSNVVIRGGNLVGDRDEHDYSKSNPGEGGNHLFWAHGASNVLVEGVNMSMGSAGALVINSINFTFQDNYIPSNGITVRNCVFKDNRRMSTAITDGFNLVIEDNTYIDTGLDRQNSDGGVVGYAINVEAVRARDASGNFIYYERAYDILIRNNFERGSRIGAITVSVGENVTIENNDLENKITYSLTSGTKILNNRLVASTESAKTPAILAAGNGETVFNNQISGNYIEGYGIGIAAYHGELIISNNTLVNNGNGIQLKELNNTDIYNNSISSSQSASRGISFQISHGNDVRIFNNDFNVIANHLYFVQVNQEIDFINNLIQIYDNRLNSSATSIFSVTNGIIFERNSSFGRVQISNSSSVRLIENIIDSANSHGVNLTGINRNIELNSNTIEYPANTNFQCIYIDNATSPTEVLLDNNECIGS
ncbi:NosD domain-containing protein [Robiginitalea sp. M366]|uniref:NosD domain-containing protein n=1 Tax=Robiginitalea aestuariiviva TaxID=3036903 RepID=UPI00240D2FAB|nr:NosD domain-containing protein [Robiginitalea aestuariiviva]MDG1572728.1 NosD domain-containing protein [Robiginitalea aestuariiviva]